MTALTAPARTLARPTTLEAMTLRLAAKASQHVERRMEQRAARAALTAPTVLAQAAASERMRDGAAAHAIGLMPR